MNCCIRLLHVGELHDIFLGTNAAGVLHIPLLFPCTTQTPISYLSASTFLLNYFLGIPLISLLCFNIPKPTHLSQSNNHHRGSLFLDSPKSFSCGPYFELQISLKAVTLSDLNALPSSVKHPGQSNHLNGRVITVGPAVNHFMTDV